MPSVALSVDDTLTLVTVGDHAWNADGSRIGHLRFEDGETRLAVNDVGATDTTALALTDGAFTPDIYPDLGAVTAFAWHPTDPDRALVLADGELHSADMSEGTVELFSAAPEPHGVPAWHPDGACVAYLRDRTLWVHGVDGRVRDLSTDAPFQPADLFGPTPLAWSPDGRYIGLVVESDAETLGVAVWDTHGDEVVWATVPAPGDDCLRADFAWVGPDHLVYAEDSMDGAERVYRSVRIGEDEGEGVAIASESVDGLLLPHRPVGHESGRLAVLSAASGYRHVYAIDVDARRAAVTDDRPGMTGDGVCQVTDGPFEARGDSDDRPAWSPDGDRLAYVTNEHDPGERQLEIATLSDGSVVDRQRFDGIRGNAIYPVWGPDGARVCCLRSGRFTPTDVHVADLESGAMVRVTAAHPDPSVFEGLPDPEPVEFDSADGATVYGYLYVPPDADGPVPSVVLCHGGPIAQMRRGFHHGRTYGYFHLFDQYLVSEGYAVLELNFRSGVGYGDAFEQAIQRNVGVVEVEDCVAAAEYLRSRPETTDRVGMWGRSYGGFLANILATKTDAYDCTVNVAGIWDWRTWEAWAIDLGPTHWGAAEPTWFHNRFGGPPDSADEAVQERYRVGSPNTFVEGLDTPLLALHGSTDKNVTVGELEVLTTECIEAGVPFEPINYPDEEHMFERPETWRDALGRVTAFFETHL